MLSSLIVKGEMDNFLYPYSPTQSPTDALDEMCVWLEDYTSISKPGGVTGRTDRSIGNELCAWVSSQRPGQDRGMTKQ